MAPSDLQRAFGERIRELRAERGLSQEALAHLAGINRTYLGDVERGERNIALENMAKLACAFGVSLSTLLDHPKVDRQTRRASRATKSGQR